MIENPTTIEFAEVKSDRIVRRGRITTLWSGNRQVLRITYIVVRTGEGDGEPAVNTYGRLSFNVALKAGQSWHRCWRMARLGSDKARLFAPLADVVSV